MENPSLEPEVVALHMKVAVAQLTGSGLGQTPGAGIRHVIQRRDPEQDPDGGTSLTSLPSASLSELLKYTVIKRQISYYKILSKRKILLLITAGLIRPL